MSIFVISVRVFESFTYRKHEPLPESRKSHTRASLVSKSDPFITDLKCIAKMVVLFSVRKLDPELESRVGNITENFTRMPHPTVWRWPRRLITTSRRPIIINTHFKAARLSDERVSNFSDHMKRTK